MAYEFQAGAQFLVNTQISGTQGVPSIARLTDGGFIIAWEDDSGTLGDDSLNGIKAQRYDVSGASVGSEFYLLTVLLQDLKFGIRSLRRTPAFTAVVIAVMALGIGVNTMVFSMVYGVMLRPLPLPGAERLVSVDNYEKKQGSAEDFELSLARCALLVQVGEPRRFRFVMATLELDKPCVFRFSLVVEVGKLGGFDALLHAQRLERAFVL